MGTTMSYIQLRNRGFTVEELQTCLKALADDLKSGAYIPDNPFRQMLEADLFPNSLEILREIRAAERDLLAGPPQIAFQPDAKWLPLFQAHLCDGNTLSTQNLERLSKTFGTPVIAFNIFDSDALSLSCCDGAAGSCLDYVKPNWDGNTDYDMPHYRKDFPEFLNWLCPPEQRADLRAVWDGEEIFADDRMWKLFELLGMEAIDPGAEHFPEGFEIVYPE